MLVYCLTAFLILFNTCNAKHRYGKTPLIATIPDWTKLVVTDSTIIIAESEQRIIDANGNIDIKDVPFLVSILHRGRHECGGSIIRNDVILTAAHCLIGFNPEKLQVRAGSSFNHTGGVVVNVNRFVAHEKYTFTEKDSDIGLIWLEQPLTPSEEIQIIPLTRAGVDVPVGTYMSVSGFGYENETNVFADKLQGVVVPVVEQVECDRKYNNREITPNMICAGYSSGGADACTYDSGGPLVHDGIQYGVVSFGRGCARAGFPGVYARISALRPWIDKKLSFEEEEKKSD